MSENLENSTDSGNTKVYKLNYPIVWGSETITELNFTRRLKAKDFKGLPVGALKLDHIILLIARITGKPTALLDELDASDLQELAQVIESFLSHGQETGVI